MFNTARAWFVPFITFLVNLNKQLMNDSLFVLCRTIIPWRKVVHFDPSQGSNMNSAPTLSVLATKLTQKEDGDVVAWFEWIEKRALADTELI